jgi:hypothetical protein
MLARRSKNRAYGEEGRRMTAKDPYNLDAEKAMLCAMLREPDCIEPAASIAGPADFSRAHAPIYMRAVELWQAGQNVDVITVANALKEHGELEAAGGPVYIASLTDMGASGANVRAYAEIIRKAADARKTKEVIEKALHSDASDPQIIIDNLITNLQLIRQPKTSAGFQPPEHWILRDVADLQSWPCKSIEWVIEDIAAKSNLVWVSADSQTGKTLIGLYNALQLIRGGYLYGKFKIYPVEKILYLVLEDPDRRIKDRILDILHSENPQIEPNKFHTYFASGLNIGDDLQFDFFELMMSAYDVVYLDTYQRATPGILSFDDAKQSLIVHRLSAMTRKYNTLLFVHDHFRVAQETRGKRKADPDKSRTKGTGGKIQNADCAISMDKEGDKIRVKIESKEGSAVHYFMLQVSPKGSLEDKFIFVGDIEQIAADMAALGKANLEKVYEAIPEYGEISIAELAAKIPTMKARTVQNHLKTLIDAKRACANGKKARAIRYQRCKAIAQEETPACGNPVSEEDVYV